MDRIRTQAVAEPIAHALSLIPEGIRRRVSHARFIAGVDPIFAGFHSWGDVGDGRSYCRTAHVCYEMHLRHRPVDDRQTTVVLPRPRPPWVVVHELGHVLHEAISFDCHVPRPVTAYATTNDWEAFAEAFTAWVCPEVYPWAAEILAQDPATPALFEELAR